MNECKWKSCLLILKIGKGGNQILWKKVTKDKTFLKDRVVLEIGSGVSILELIKKTTLSFIDWCLRDRNESLWLLLSVLNRYLVSDRRGYNPCDQAQLSLFSLLNLCSRLECEPRAKWDFENYWEAWSNHRKWCYLQYGVVENSTKVSFQLMSDALQDLRDLSSCRPLLQK